MSEWMPWAIAGKDFKVLGRKKSIAYTLVVFPLVIAVGLPAIGWLLITRDAVLAANLIPYFNVFAFFFVVVASFLPSAIASYSIVGEKVEKSLEPLLATPVTDDEILLGAIYMVLVDVITLQPLGYLYYPDWTAAVLFLLAAPLACLFSVELSVIVSARVTDVRAAQQFGRLLLLPFAAVYVLGEIGIVPLVADNLLIISAVLLVVDVVLFSISRSTFKREEILTKWK
jgi:ABC-type Na+ efflux pump permease subunit